MSMPKADPSRGPYGGFKKSGIGRDFGELALDHYQQTKTVYVNLDDPML